MYGLFLEGARWDADERVLAEQYPKQLNEELPVIWLKTEIIAEMDEYPHYEAPLYREASRCDHSHCLVASLVSSYIHHLPPHWRPLRLYLLFSDNLFSEILSSYIHPDVVC